MIRADVHMKKSEKFSFTFVQLSEDIQAVELLKKLGQKFSTFQKRKSAIDGCVQ